MSDIDFHWHLGSVPDPLSELTTLPRPLSVYLKGLILSGSGRKGKGGRGRRGKRRGRTEGRDEGGGWERPVEIVKP